MKYQAFVFDFDGVLANSVEVKTRAFEQLYLSHGPEIAAAVVRHHRENGGMPRRLKFKHYEATFLGTPADNDRLDQLSNQFSALVVDKVVAAPEIPGATIFLRNWFGTLPMFVDSASPDTELQEIIKRRKLDGFWAAVYGSNRDKAENLKSILNDYDLQADKVLFFGDAMSDLAASRECGTDFIGIVRESCSPIAKEPVLLFKDFFQIQDHLTQLES